MGATRNPSVKAAWSPCGRYLMTATTAPRLRVDNNVRVFDYVGESVWILQPCQDAERLVALHAFLAVGVYAQQALAWVCMELAHGQHVCQHSRIASITSLQHNHSVQDDLVASSQS